MNDDDDLLFNLPVGDAAYTRETDGTWGVAIFAPGSAQRLVTVATGMDKSIAAWFALKLEGFMRSTKGD